MGPGEEDGKSPAAGDSPDEVHESVQSHRLGGEGPGRELATVHQRPQVRVRVITLHHHGLLAGQGADGIEAATARGGGAVVHGGRSWAAGPPRSPWCGRSAPCCPRPPRTAARPARTSCGTRGPSAWAPPPSTRSRWSCTSTRSRRAGSRQTHLEGRAGDRSAPADVG